MNKRGGGELNDWMNSIRRKLPVLKSKELGNLGPGFGVGAGCGIGFGIGFMGGIYNFTSTHPYIYIHMKIYPLHSSFRTQCVYSTSPIGVVEEEFRSLKCVGYR